jgi:hypothetical protein
MVLYNDLDVHQWGLEDFTDENALSITGTIYSDKNLTTAFDLTGYTLTLRIIDNQGHIIEDNSDDIEIVTAGSGTWRFKPQDGRMFTELNGQIVVRLEKSGSQISAIGINGSSDLLVVLV